MVQEESTLLEMSTTSTDSYYKPTASITCVPCIYVLILQEIVFCLDKVLLKALRWLISIATLVVILIFHILSSIIDHFVCENLYVYVRFV